jgi:signal peptidase I
MDNNIYAISYKMRQELYRRIASISKIILICFVAISIFMNFLLYPVLSRSNSMSPDISAGSVEFVVPFLRTPSRGDVVLVQNHGSADLNIVKRFLNQCFLFVTARQWQPFGGGNRSGALPMLRRVVGMPGDTIYIDKYVVYIKPKGESHFLTEFELIDKKYDVEIFTAPTGWDINLGAKSGTKQIVLGDGQYYLLGDNRMECMDSRLWGAVKKSAIKGRVVLQYFPFNKIKAF